MVQDSNFLPKNDIPDLTGKVFFITGGVYHISLLFQKLIFFSGTAGLGKQAILELSQHNPQHIYFTGRNSERAAEVISEANKQSPSVGLTFIECDQTSLASVEAATKEFIAKSSTQLDVLILNAGVMALPPATTKDGYEVQFGINHLAHALFVKAFLPIIRRTATEKSDARIVILTSVGHKLPPSGGIVFDKLQTTQETLIGGAWFRYGQSKLANVIYASELAKRYPEIIAVSIHPGVINTELISNLNTLNRIFVHVTTMGQQVEPHKGAYNTEWAATTDKKNITSGSYYEPVGALGKRTSYSTDPKLGEKLWEWTQRELEHYGNS